MSNRWQHLERDRAELIDRIWDSESGVDWCLAWTDKVDAVVQSVFDEAYAGLRAAPTVALVATGGYGRKELAPFSDIDLCVLPQDEAHPALDQLTKTIFRELNDGFRQLKIKVGYNFRLVADLPGLDATSRTALIDTRRVAGDAAVVRKLQTHLWDDIPIGAFLIAKIAERRSAERRFNSTPLVVTPHLKEGAGGLRSAQCANWIRAAVGERTLQPSEAYDRVLHFRNRLHAVAEGHLDVLTRSKQAVIADRLGSDVFELLRDLWPNTLELQQELEDTLNRLRVGRFRLTPRVWNYDGSVRIEPAASVSEAAMALSYAEPLGLSIENLPIVVQPTVEFGEAALALRGGSKAVRQLDRAGVLEHLLPSLTACKAVAPKDSMHEFSVFEHTLQTLEHLERVVAGSPPWAEIFAEVRDPALLNLAILLHDVGKLLDQPNHAEIGAGIAAQVAADWRLDPRDAATLEWLVRHHLEMARFARMRDVHLPETAQEFAAFVGDLERLRLLTLLTVADIAAVSSESLTPVLEGFLLELYARSAAEIESDVPLGVDLAEYRRRVVRKAEPKDVDAVMKFVDSLPAHYMAAMPVETAERHFELLQKAHATGVALEFGHLEDQSTEVTVCLADTPGLLSRILGVIYALDLSLVAVRAHTTASTPSYAIDVFTVTFGGKALAPNSAAKLINELRAVLSGAKSVDDVLRSHSKDPTREQELYRWTFVEGSPAILEFQAPRGRGMAYRLSRMLSRIGWNVLTARVGIWAGQGAAAFYVSGPNGALTRAEVEAVFGRQV